MLIHENEIYIPLFTLSPKLCYNMIVAAVCMTSHYHSLIKPCQILESLFLILSFQWLGKVKRLHFYQNIYAPTVSHPVGEVCIIMCRNRPYNSSVFHLATPRLILHLIGLLHDLVYIVESLDDTWVKTTIHFIVPLAEQLIAWSDELWVRCLVDLPLLKLILCFYIEPLHCGKICIPVPLSTSIILNKLNASLYIFYRRIHYGFVLISNRESQMISRKILESAVCIGRCHY